MSAQEVEPIANPEPRVRQWLCNDGYIVGYTLERYGMVARPEGAEDAPHGEGKYGFFVYKPTGKGSRSGNPQQWDIVGVTYRDKRSDVKDMALAAYFLHNGRA